LALQFFRALSKIFSGKDGSEYANNGVTAYRITGMTGILLERDKCILVLLLVDVRRGPDPSLKA